MDTITHSLVAVALSRAFFKKRVAYATTALVVAVNLPDLDVLYSWPGIRWIEYHRGILASLCFLPVWAVLVAWGLRWCVRRWPPRREPNTPAALPVPSWGAGMALGATGVASHILLDWTNAYGIRLFAPFSQTWYALDWTPQWDPILWLLLTAVLLVPMLLALIRTEVGATRKNPHRISGALALALLAAWIGLRARQHDAALDLLNTNSTWRYFGNELPLNWAVMPHKSSPYDWQAVVDLPSRVVVADIQEPWDTRRGRFQLQRIYVRPPQGPEIADAEQTPTAQAFLQFARFPFADAEIPSDGGPRIVTITDMRFARGLARPGMHVTITLDPSLQVVSQRFHWHRP